MGVPKFFRWAGDRYPAIVSGILNPEERDSNSPAHCPPIDNLYLDMNGMIHNCSHNNDGGISFNVKVEDVLEQMFDMIDYFIFTLVRPQKLLFLAIDGVAPRAKLNQQRARRFRAGKALELELQQIKEASGVSVSNAFDSNCITPGTEFMVKISQGIQAFIMQRMNDNLTYSKLEVIFSGSEVPGEGEHKIISYIRDEKANNRVPLNARHCIYGADADMIMLSLATHEPYFIILRDINEFSKKSFRKSHGQADQHPADPLKTLNTTPVKKKPQDRKMQYIRIHILREYLFNEFFEDFLLAHSKESMHRKHGQDKHANDVAHVFTKIETALEDGSRFEWNPERVFDDFIFLTFLIGNDFLPHLPGLDIGDAAFDIIFDAYKNAMSSENPGYLVERGQIRDVERLELIFELIATQENVIYAEKEMAANAKAQRQKDRAERNGTAAEEDAAAAEHGPHHPKQDKHHFGGAHNHKKVDAEDSNNTQQHEIPLNEDEYRRVYYFKKLGIAMDADTVSKLHIDMAEEDRKLHGKTRTTLDQVIHEYLLGLSWNLAYYSTGCVSWGWYYPFHYGPFLQDMKGLSALFNKPSPYTSEPLQGDFNWLQGVPLTPFQQLLACLPPQSASLLPPAYSFLMRDAASPITDFYPTEFSTDLNGKRNDYEAVVLLPFIDVQRLKDAESQHCLSTLTHEEQQRNSFGIIHQYRTEDGHRLVTKDIVPTIHHGISFKSELTEGTDMHVKGYPNLSQLVAAANSITDPQFFGKTMYFKDEHGRSSALVGAKSTQPGNYYKDGGDREGGGGGRGGRGGGRGHHDDHGGRGHHEGRGGGRGHHQPHNDGYPSF